MMNGQPMMGGQMMNGQQIMGGQPMMGGYPTEQSVNVQPAQFSAFSGGTVGGYPAENIGLIMDVPLEVTVELGRTQKSISDILDFGPGKIIELNKICCKGRSRSNRGKFWCPHYRNRECCETNVIYG